MPSVKIPWKSVAGIYVMAMMFFYVIPTQLPFRLVEAGYENAALAGYAIAISTFAAALAALGFKKIKSLIPAPLALTCIFGCLGLGILVAGVFES